MRLQINKPENDELCEYGPGFTPVLEIFGHFLTEEEELQSVF